MQMMFLPEGILIAKLRLCKNCKNSLTDLYLIHADNLILIDGEPNLTKATPFIGGSLICVPCYQLSEMLPYNFYPA